MSILPLTRHLKWSMPLKEMSKVASGTSTIPYHSKLYHTIPNHTIPYLTIPYHIIAYHTMPCHTLPDHTNTIGCLPWVALITGRWPLASGGEPRVGEPLAI